MYAIRSYYEDRADRHPDELHRQHDAERSTVDAPLRGNAGRRKADRQHVETVHGIEKHADGDGNHLPSYNFV